MAKPPQARSNSQQSSRTKQNHTLAVSQEWIGPLPPPDVIERFNAIVPNGAERIFAMAEKEQSHRIAIEDRGLSASIAEAKHGQILGAIISIFSLLSAVGSVYMVAHPAVSVALVGVPIAGLVKAIVDSRSK